MSFGALVLITGQGLDKETMISLVIITLLLGASVIFLLFTLWRSDRVRRWTAGLGRRRFLNSLSRKNHEKILNGDTSNAQSVQESLLLNILETHQNTEYGQKHNFKDITDVSSFQKLHPLTHYSDYKDYIQRTREGEENILLQGRPHALIVTAGTLGNPSVIPVSTKGSRDRFLKGTAVYLEVIQSHFPSALEKVAKFTFPPDENHSEAGIPIIPYPSVCFFSLLEKIYLSPFPIHNSMCQYEILYTQLLFALKDVELRILEANYSWFLRHVFSILEEHWESLIKDIQQGRLNPEFKLPLNIRKQIEDGLIPDAVRAEELRTQFREGFCGIAKRVWPNLQVVITLESGSSDLDRQILKDTVCQGVPFYSPMYCTAEGLCGVNLSPVESIPQYVLCPSSAFFEFIPVETSDQDQPHTLCIQDVTKAKAYELVITNRDGLYRYRLGDIVQVTGFHNHSPILELLYRKSQTLSVRGEHISESGFYKSLLHTVSLWPGASLLNYCCAESGIMGPFSGGSDPHYQVFVALKGVRDLSEEQRYKDGSRQKQKKTVSFSTMPNNRKINSTAACISFMMEGCEMKKVRSNSRMYNRFFLLDPDMRFLHWEPSKKDSDKAKLEIKSIREVRVGKKTPVLRSNGLSDQFPEECAFSIIYGENYESLDLVASTADIVNTWVMGLRYLVSYGKHTPDVVGANQTSSRTLWISSLFEIADIEKKGQVPLSRAIQLIKGLNPGMKTSTVELKFKEVQKVSDKYGSNITCDVFVEAYCELCTRPEVFFLLVQFSSNKEYLDLKDLMIFMEVEQGMEEVNENTALEIINKYEPYKEGREKGYLTIDGFTRYLLSSDCNIFDPDHKVVCQDMTRPLSHYYINSAHNACHLEDHYWGTSDISGYIHALKMGCRSIELVVWDGPDNEPLIYLGLSVVSQVAFRSVISVIDKYAFEASEYPLILCLVVHCSVRQQRFMTQCLKKILGDKLYLDPPFPDENYLPSPEQLKGKIIIKGKKLPSDNTDSDGDVTDEDEGMEIARRLGQDGREHLNGAGHRKLRLSKELSDQVALCQSIKFKDFENSKRNQKYWHVCSFNEVTASRFANEYPEEFVKYNKKFLSRVYPSSMRIDSSNMNPQDFWKCGCQIVAMNYQMPGLMMDLNTGWFRQNGNCGYVLRPSIMREEVSYFSANAKDCLPGVSAQLLHIKLISGQNLPKPKGSGAKGDVVEPYIYVEIHGIPADCAEHRTKTVTQNGDNPIFDDSFEFHINLPELAILRFVVLDDDYIGDEFIAQYTIPFECLQTGFRHVPLQSLTGEFLQNTTLFVHIAITNRRGGGKAHKRGLSVRKGKKVREYTSTKTTGIKAIDEVFRTATPSLREATDLRENVQNALVSFKELCGLTPTANMKQCILTVSAWLLNSDSPLNVTLNLRSQYPLLEAHGPVPDLLKKVLTSYEVFIQASRTLIETSDTVYNKIIQVQKTGMGFHEDLHRIGAKEGLKGRKLQKAMESFAWNITVLKGQADLLKHAKNEAVDHIRQIHHAGQSCGISRDSSHSPSLDVFRPRGALEPIPETDGGGSTGS